MSSPAGLQYSQADFLARWMPSSTRAGVILNPCADLAGSMRHVSSVGSPHPPLEPDDSFASDFAPLPASADSSCCIGVDGFARSAGRQKTDADGPVDGRSPGPQRNTHGESESLDEMANTSQDLPLRMKLEQLRKWQQLMQEQLKAHQLEELLRLQEEQQRLLGVMNGSQDSTEGTPYHSTSACRRAQQGSACGQEQELSSAGRRTEPHTDQDHEEGSEDEGSWNSREDDEEQSVDLNQFHERDVTSKRSKAASLNGNTSVKGDTELHERPIKQGVGGQKKTFEELLEEQLRMEEQRLKSAQQQQGQEGAAAAQAPPKRVFLKRGEGLSRFTNNRKPKQAVTDEPRPQAQARVLCRSNSDPAALQRGVSNGVQRFPVRRKTATLNKENRPKGVSSPPQDAKFERTTAWTKVLGSHQRRNTDVPQPVQTDPESKGTKLHQPEQNNKRESSQALRDAGHSMKPNPVTKQVGAIRGPERGDSDAAREGGRGSSRGGGEVPQDSFEQSFQEKLQRWDCDRQVENIELGEFELLEQAAEELSFSSNSSFVLKVLQMDQLQAARGFPPRRLSSTPIKSPPKAAPQRCTSVSSSSSSSGGGVVVQSGAVKPDVFMVKVRDGALMNGASVEERTELDSGREDDHESCEVSSCGGSEFEYQEVGGKPPSFPSSLSFPAQSDLPYDKHSYQDEESCRDSASDVTQVDDGESDSFLSNADESTLLEDKDGRQGPVVFDDNDTWNDPEHAAVCSANDGRLSPVTKVTVSPPARTLQRKVAASKVAEAVDKGVDVSSANQEPPPASQLMTRLFPSLKPKTQNAPLPPPPPPPPPPSAASIESKKSEEDTGVQVTSRQLRERLVELEVEIERFKKENSALGKLRQENEKNQETLRKERLEFEKTRAEELAKLEEHKREENRKLQKERRLFEKHALAARAMPDKKEREEIQVLRQQLISLQEELRARESRWASTHGRLRQQIDSLNKENESLRDEVRMLEKLRLTALRKSPLNASKDAPKMFDGNASSAPKGVKFASPLDSRVSSSSSSPPQSSATAAPGKTCRESSQAAAAMKSSLRKPSLPASSSSSSLPPRRKEERPTPAPCKSQDKLRHQEKSKPSPSTEEPESCEVKEPESAREVITHPDGKVEKVLASGDRLISFPNGTRKEVSGDGLTVKVTFFNGDTKQITADQRVIYYYAETQTTHITYTDGIEVLHFPNNQTEKHFPDGRKEITFPDQTVKNLFPNGREESVLTDGTVIQVNPDGTKEIHFNTGQREIHTADFKRREYPDGTVKTVYADGRQETSYPTGRLRIKDKDGNVVVDNGV